MKNNIIANVIKEHNLQIDEFENYTNEIAKIIKYQKNNNNSKLVIVTSMSPTPVGEGKTTTSIGLIDGLNKLGIKTIGALREPSMGPVFGMKGTGSGSNKAILLPFDKINLHFTGDFHAIASANNLISAVIDNEIYFQSELNIDPTKIIWKRCLDSNDRQLREIEYTISKINSIIKTGFNITAASDMMALFCLSKDMNDFKDKLNKTIVAYTYNNKPISVEDLKISDAIMKIMEDAFYPNLVRTLENNPVILHGGPFANIAHGCSSLISLYAAQNLGDVVVTEAGFGSDLGLEKFMNITCRVGDISPDLIILTISLKSILYNGTKSNANQTNQEKILVGFENVKHHINHCKKYNKSVFVAINHRDEDLDDDMKLLAKLLDNCQVEYAINDCWANGSNGALEMSKKVAKILKNTSHSKHPYLYDINDSVYDKIDKICKNAYGAKGYELSKLAKSQLEELESFKNYYVCISKNPYSLTCDQKILGKPTNFVTTIERIEINYAANLIIPITSVVYRMPGLPKIPRAKNFILK
ncbi:MAG: formate--tetrahydrofolate ligase [Ureaplasma sp.]|nr:formate--tetrahydrofolate ligase [Ureaplasma sp.]MDE7221719.1 formate--tetrahydrofolate ligase [Ureaplasma sp.]